jgi:hypothetical protein
MKGIVIVQGVETEDFMDVFIEKLLEKIKLQNDWIGQAKEAIPVLSAGQVATALNCSPALIPIIIERYPERLKPIFKKGKTYPVYSTEEVLALRQKGGYKGGYK